MKLRQSDGTFLNQSQPGNASYSKRKEVTSHRWVGRWGGCRSCERWWRWRRWRSEKLETAFVLLSRISCRCSPADKEQGRKNTVWAPPTDRSVHYIQRGQQANSPLFQDLTLACYQVKFMLGALWLDQSRYYSYCCRANEGLCVCL